MGSGNHIDTLFQYACDYRFDEFENLINECSADMSEEDVGEAYLMRAQIKLYTADASLIKDLEEASLRVGPARFPRLSSMWQLDAPNRFIVFSQEPGHLQRFIHSLDQVRETMRHWLGDQADVAVRQMQGELSYFCGDTRRAYSLAKEQIEAKGMTYTDGLLAQALRFRSCLALGLSHEAEESMLAIVALSQKLPECLAAYQSLRNWANLTTNWSGDSPRFYIDSEGTRQPVLKDRIEGVRSGSSQMTSLEAPFIHYAERSYGNAYALRQHYMDLLHAMYWLQSGDEQQAESYFLKVGHTASQSGVIMPLIECGEQVTPLLYHAKQCGWECLPDWIDGVISQAELYEKHLKAYQDTGE